MLNSIFFRCLLCTAILSASGLSHGKNVNVSTDLSGWEWDEKAKLSGSTEGLVVKALSNNTWLSPKESFTYEPGTALKMEYQLRSGNVIVQANWFDLDGNYLETSKLGMDTSDNTTAQFSVVKPESAVYAKTYRIKIWLEAELPSFELKSLAIAEGVAASKFLFQTPADFEPTDDLKVRILKDGAVDLELRGNSSSGSIHTASRFNIKSTKALSVMLDDISYGTSFSMQLLYWDASGTYLGHQDVLKDVTEVTGPAVIDMSTAPKDVSTYSIKFWLSGYAGSSAEVKVSQG
ncbi:hypothetical protein [Rubellicoccus peritrichatus]|uniref:Uncharacterized protein n=1 Tax=Rubellicoccus peritrichatus TaxID=3080537 RepID=A0AAQ3LC60_9BACT|nr:hypothetical protein [Puniceicoccus sp. CR14]WOO41844.1 hypothetical protein RZN69_02005 [Puniceicoccus sp. CR14]